MLLPRKIEANDLRLFPELPTHFGNPVTHEIGVLTGKPLQFICNVVSLVERSCRCTSDKIFKRDFIDSEQVKIVVA